MKPMADSTAANPTSLLPKRSIKELVEKGRSEDARALECAVCHSCWNGARAYSHLPRRAICVRCGLMSDTLLHTYWTCSDNLKSE